MENYKTEYPEEFLKDFKTIDINSIKYDINKIRLTINYSFDEPIKYVSVLIEISLNDEEVGYYDCIFGLDGSIEDDYFSHNA